MNRQAAVAAAAAATAILAHFASIDNKWAYDDKVAIQSNPDVVANRPLHEAFLNDFWGHSLRPKTAAEDPNANFTWWSHHSYRPLTVLTFRANIEMAQPTGLRGAAHIFHATNILIQAAACAALVPLLTALTGTQSGSSGGKQAGGACPGSAGRVTTSEGEADIAKPLHRPRSSGIGDAQAARTSLVGRAATWVRRWTAPRPAVQSLAPSALTVIAALAFAAHPIHVESVANATHRAEPLCCLLLFLAWAAYERATRPRRPGVSTTHAAVAAGAWAALAASLHIAAVLAKETAIAFPAVVVVADVAATMLRRQGTVLARASPRRRTTRQPSSASEEGGAAPLGAAPESRELVYEQVSVVEDISDCAAHGGLVIRCALVLLWAACVFYGRVVVLTGGYSLNMQAMHNPISTLPSFVDRTLSFGLVQAFAASLLFVPALLSHEHNAIEPVTSFADPRNLATLALWAGIAAILAWAAHSGHAWRSSEGASTAKDGKQPVTFRTTAVEAHLVRPPAPHARPAAIGAHRNSAHAGTGPAANHGSAGNGDAVAAPLTLQLYPPSPIARRWRLLGGLGVAAAAYLPASHVVVVVGFVLAERQLYLPSLGAAILMAEVFLGLSELVGSLFVAEPVQRGPAARLAWACGCTGLALRPVGTFIRSPGQLAPHGGGMPADGGSGSADDGASAEKQEGSSADVLSSLEEPRTDSDGALRIRADGVAVWDRGTSTEELERTLGLTFRRQRQALSWLWSGEPSGKRRVRFVDQDGSATPLHAGDGEEEDATEEEGEAENGRCSASVAPAARAAAGAAKARRGGTGKRGGTHLQGSASSVAASASSSDTQRLPADAPACIPAPGPTASIRPRCGTPGGFVLWTLALAAVFVFVVRSSVRASVWFNDESVGNDLVARYPRHNPMARYGSGMTRIYQGKLMEAASLLLESTELSGFAEPRIALSELLWKDVIPALLLDLNGRPDHEEVIALRNSVRSHCLFGGPGVVVLQVSGEVWVAANYSQGWPRLPPQVEEEEEEEEAGSSAVRRANDSDSGAGCVTSPAMLRPAEAVRVGAALLNASSVGSAVRAAQAMLEFVDQSRSARREFFGMLGLLRAAVPAAEAVDALAREAGPGVQPGLSDKALALIPSRMFRELPFPGADPTSGPDAFPRLRGDADGPVGAALNSSEFISLVAQAANTLPASHYQKFVLSSNAFVNRLLSPAWRWGSVQIAMKHADHAGQTDQMTLRVVKANLACMWATAGLLDRAVAEAAQAMAVRRTTNDSGEAVELTVASSQAVQRFAVSEAGKAMAARWAQLDGGTDENMLKMSPGPHVGYRAQAVGCAFIVLPLAF